jgi:hypothetical protein
LWSLYTPVSDSGEPKHLMKFAERLVDGKFEWRFASQLRFPYWALNMKQLYQLLSQANVYLRHHPADASIDNALTEADSQFSECEPNSE